METLSLELDEETLQALEVERSLIGFEDRAAYVRWIIQHRAAIEHEAEAGEVLAAYSDRIADLESRLASIEDTAEVGSDDAGAKASESDAESGAAVSAADGKSEPMTQQTTPDGGWTDTGTGSGANATDSGDPDQPATPSAGPDSATSSESAADGSLCAKNLRPERVERIRDESLSEDAGVLGTVEVDRLDELSRRAVAKTREQLDRDVETGLEYRSSTPLSVPGDDVRPGADVADLDSIEVPGRSSDLESRRRELIGQALAHLRDEGSARKADFVDALYEEYPAGYGSTGGWWRCLKRGLKQVSCVDGGDGSRIWTIDD